MRFLERQLTLGTIYNESAPDRCHCFYFNMLLFRTLVRLFHGSKRKSLSRDPPTSRAAPPTATGQVSVQSLLILWVEFCPSKFHTLES